MFTPIHLLPQNGRQDHRKYRDRWDTPEGQALHEDIIARIRRGGGEHLLEADFQAGRLGFIEDEYDLRGFIIQNESIVFPYADNFNAIDFSYGQFNHSKFTNAHFYCVMALMRFNHCIFEKCSFTFTHWFGSNLENVQFIDCDFIEYNSFLNCSFAKTTFQNSFIPNNMFQDCRFDAETKFTSFPRKPKSSASTSLELKDSSKAELFQEIGLAFSSSGANQLSRRYLFLSSHYRTRHNTNSTHDKFKAFISEYLTGYFLRPARPIIAMIIYFMFILGLFSTQASFDDALLLSSGSLFTFGANADLLDHMSLLYRLLYIVSSFVGISLTALFITVLANVSIRQK